MNENKKPPQVARTTSEEMEVLLRLSELDHKIGTLLLADKYHRILHALGIVLLVLILFW